MKRAPVFHLRKIVIIMLGIRTVNNTSDYTLKTSYCSYFKGISANIELQMYNVTCS
jgi:hypothetical protein